MALLGRTIPACRLPRFLPVPRVSYPPPLERRLPPGVAAPQSGVAETKRTGDKIADATSFHPLGCGSAGQPVDNQHQALLVFDRPFGRTAIFHVKP
jgi:hypothetical protein